MSDGLTLQHVTIGKDGRTLITIDRHVPPGDVLTVMGPSGSGKSTLLAYIIGTLPAAFEASGRIVLNGADVTDRAPDRRRIGILFQDDLLFPHLSVGANLAFGLRGGSRSGRRQRIGDALEEVGLGGFEARDPATLSGGQKSRVALMRMLLSDPGALMLDEAFSRLDADLRDRTRRMVFETARNRDLPVIMVTHDSEDADAAAGTVVRLDDGRKDNRQR